MTHSGFSNEIFDYVFIDDEGYGRMSVHVRWMKCRLYCDERRADCEPQDCNFSHTFPRGGSIQLERLLPTGRLEIAFQQIRPWGGRGTASAEAAKMNYLLRKCTACSISETRAVHGCHGRPAFILLQAMQGRGGHRLVPRQGVPGEPFSRAQARML